MCRQVRDVIRSNDDLLRWPPFPAVSFLTQYWQRYEGLGNRRSLVSWRQCEEQFAAEHVPSPVVGIGAIGQAR